MNFKTWNVELLEEITLEGRHYGSFCCFIDATIPYDLGWSPKRAAHAMLGKNVRDRQVLIDISKEHEHAAKRQDPPSETVPQGVQAQDHRVGGAV